MSEFVNNPAYNYYYSALPLPILHDTRLKDRDRRLLAAFYFFAGKTNRVYNKTREELGRIAGMAKNIVSVTSARLVQLGWLKKAGDGGRGQSAVYELTVPDTFTHLQRKTRQERIIQTTEQSGISHLTQEKPTIREIAPTPQKPPIPAKSLSRAAQNNTHPLAVSLTYPDGLESTFANSFLTQLPETQQQTALDEWLGQTISYKKRNMAVSSPYGLLRSIIKSILAGQPIQHANVIKKEREWMHIQHAHTIKKEQEYKQKIHQALGYEPIPQKKEASNGKPSKPAIPQNFKETLFKIIDGGSNRSVHPSVKLNEKTRHSLLPVLIKNPSHFVTPHIEEEPNKNIKTTTTSSNENIQKSLPSGGSGIHVVDDNSFISSNTNRLTKTKKHKVIDHSVDKQTQQCSTPAKSTSSHGFVEKPSVQSPGRGQLNSCPPRLIFTTSSTRPDALRLPKQINKLAFQPLKTLNTTKKPNNFHLINSSSTLDISNIVSANKVFTEKIRMKNQTQDGTIKWALTQAFKWMMKP